MWCTLLDKSNREIGKQGKITNSNTISQSLVNRLFEPASLNLALRRALLAALPTELTKSCHVIIASLFIYIPFIIV